MTAVFIVTKGLRQREQISTRRGSKKQSAKIISRTKKSIECFQMWKWSEYIYSKMVLKQIFGTPTTLILQPLFKFDSLKRYLGESIAQKQGDLALRIKEFPLIRVSSIKKRTSQKSFKFLHWLILTIASLNFFSCLSSGDNTFNSGSNSLN